MFLVRRVSLSAFFLPHSRRNLRKVHIRFGSCTVYFRQTKFVGEWQRLLIDTCSSYDIYVFIFFATLQSGGERREHFRTGTLQCRIGRDNHISAIR